MHKWGIFEYNSCINDSLKMKLFIIQLNPHQVVLNIQKNILEMICKHNNCVTPKYHYFTLLRIAPPIYVTTRSLPACQSIETCVSDARLVSTCKSQDFRLKRWHKISSGLLDQKCDFGEDWSFIYYGKCPILILMKTPIVKPIRLISGLPK